MHKGMPLGSRLPYVTCSRTDCHASQPLHKLTKSSRAYWGTSRHFYCIKQGCLMKASAVHPAALRFAGGGAARLWPSLKCASCTSYASPLDLSHTVSPRLAIANEGMCVFNQGSVINGMGSAILDVFAPHSCQPSTSSLSASSPLPNAYIGYFAWASTPPPKLSCWDTL